MTLTIEQAERELCNLANSPVIDRATRDSAKCAADLVRTFRSALDLSWDAPADDLWVHACNIKSTQIKD